MKCLYIRDSFFGFEAKTEENYENPVYSEACRQASGHKKWIRESFPIREETTVDVVLISHKSTIRKDALPQSRDLFHINTSKFREFALKVTNVLRGIRSVLARDEESNLFHREHISNTIIEKKVTFQDIEKYLKENKLDELDQL